MERIGYSNAPILEARKFLVPANLGSSYFLIIMRKRLSLEPDSTLFIYINGVLVSNGLVGCSTVLTVRMISNAVIKLISRQDDDGTASQNVQG